MARAEKRQRATHPYLLHALAATSGVVAAPVISLLGLSALAGERWSIFAATIAALVAALVAVLAGSLLWSRSHHSESIPFGDLMLWTWFRRRRAEGRVDENVKRLGFDRAGRRVRGIRIDSSQQLSMLRGLTAGLEVKDPYTRHHSSRVERHCFQTALTLGLDPKDVEMLRRAASVHDVGKIHIDDRILRKPGTLTPEERQEIEKHAVIGARMVQGLGDETITRAVRHHHERWDGRGYPDGLAGGDIPLFARIIAVADTYDAITSTRAYRPRASSAQAREIIMEEAGAQFDPDVVEAFLAALADRRSVVGGFFGWFVPDSTFFRISHWAERVEVTSVAPAVASAVAVAVLAPGAILPSSPASPALRLPVAQGASGEVHSVAAAGLPSSSKLDDARASETDFARALRREARSGAVVLGTTFAAKGKRPSAIAQAGHPGSKGPTEERKPEAPPGQGAPVTGTKKAVPAPTDPQPDKGRDCDHEGNRGSRGHEIHCGP